MVITLRTSYLSSLFQLHVNIITSDQLSPLSEELDNLPSLTSHSLTTYSLSRENYIPPSAPILNTLWRDSDGPAWVKHPALESSVIVAKTLGRELRSWVVDQKFILGGPLMDIEDNS